MHFIKIHSGSKPLIGIYRYIVCRHSKAKKLKIYPCACLCRPFKVSKKKFFEKWTFKKKSPLVGIEPTAFWLLAWCLSPLLHQDRYNCTPKELNINCFAAWNSTPAIEYFTSVCTICIHYYYTYLVRQCAVQIIWISICT